MTAPITCKYGSKTFSLRDYPVHTDDGLLLPLEDGTDSLIPGQWYPTSVGFPGLECCKDEVNVLLCTQRYSAGGKASEHGGANRQATKTVC